MKIEEHKFKGVRATQVVPGIPCHHHAVEILQKYPVLAMPLPTESTETSRGRGHPTRSLAPARATPKALAVTLSTI